MERSNSEGTQRMQEVQSTAAGGLHETASAARDMARTLEHGADVLDTASAKVETVSRKMDRMSEAVSSAGAKVAKQVRAHPLAAVTAALTIGFIAGRSTD